MLEQEKNEIENITLDNIPEISFEIPSGCRTLYDLFDRFGVEYIVARESKFLDSDYPEYRNLGNLGILGKFDKDKITILNNKMPLSFDRSDYDHTFKIPKSVTNYRIEIKNVWFNSKKGTTVVLWADGVKTKVTCQNNEIFDKEKGLAMAYAKRLNSNKGSYFDVFKKFCKDDEEDEN